MKKIKFRIIAFVALLLLVSVFHTGTGVAYASETVYLGGFVTGFDVKTEGAYVLGVSDVVTENGTRAPSKDAGVAVGDVLLSIGEKKIYSSQDIELALKGYSGGSVTCVFLRDGKKVIKDVTPVKDSGGSLRLGLFVRDGASGIGTVTFVKKDYSFVALGHPVCEGETPLSAKGGYIYACSVFGLTKGERGKAGELKGLFTGEKPIGEITDNGRRGIKGKLYRGYDLSALGEVEVGEATQGEATIVATLDGVKREEFKIAIAKIDGGREEKNYLIKITDKGLLKRAGGIVQGMSGSPIVQKGRLVGAVTHVFLNDPARGYGIDVRNML